MIRIVGNRHITCICGRRRSGGYWCPFEGDSRRFFDESAINQGCDENKWGKNLKDPAERQYGVKTINKDSRTGPLFNVIEEKMKQMPRREGKEGVGYAADRDTREWIRQV